MFCRKDLLPNILRSPLVHCSHTQVVSITMLARLTDSWQHASVFLFYGQSLSCVQTQIFRILRHATTLLTRIISLHWIMLPPIKKNLDGSNRNLTHPLGNAQLNHKIKRFNRRLSYWLFACLLYCNFVSVSITLLVIAFIYSVTYI